jgi:hypothetical protein
MSTAIGRIRHSLCATSVPTGGSGPDQDLLDHEAAGSSRTNGAVHVTQTRNALDRPQREAPLTRIKPEAL